MVSISNHSANHRPRPSPWPAAALLLLGLATAAGAQINDEINAGLQFSFSPPGARSLAMGSAFSGLADDATAAYSNPAGLLWISRPEVSVEGRVRSYTTVYPDSGSASGIPRQVGIDTREDLVFAEVESRTVGLSYLSYVHVPGKRWRLAIYRHEFASFESEITSQGPFIRSTLSSGETRSRLAPLQTFTISFEYARIGYSNLEPESNALVFVLRNPNTCGDFDRDGRPQNVECVVAQSRLDRFEVDDAEEVHLGFELLVGRRFPIAIRPGAWYDPDHKMTFENPQGIGPPEDRFEPRFRPGEDEMHVTGGFGFATEKFQIDLAVDLSDRADVASVSSVFRF